MQYAQPTSTSLPHAGHFNSPRGGWPQWGQKLTLRFVGSEPPQYAHCVEVAASSSDSASSNAGSASGGEDRRLSPSGGIGFSDVQLIGSSSSSSRGRA